jgi:hypothetical protein
VKVIQMTLQQSQWLLLRVMLNSMEVTLCGLLFLLYYARKFIMG